MNPQDLKGAATIRSLHGPMAHTRAMKVRMRFVARASRRAASTVVSTFFSEVTAIRLEGHREINALPPIFDGSVHLPMAHTRAMKMASACGAAIFGGSRPFVAARLGSTQNQWFASYFRRAVSAGVFTYTRQQAITQYHDVQPILRHE